MDRVYWITGCNALFIMRWTLHSLCCINTGRDKQILLNTDSVTASTDDVRKCDIQKTMSIRTKRICGKKTWQEIADSRSELGLWHLECYIAPGLMPHSENFDPSLSSSLWWNQSQRCLNWPSPVWIKMCWHTSNNKFLMYWQTVIKSAFCWEFLQLFMECFHCYK